MANGADGGARIFHQPTPRDVTAGLREVLDKHRRWVETKEQEGERADLSRSDLSGLNLRRVNLAGADLREVNFRCANLAGADLSWAQLDESDLRGADLKGATLTAASMLGVRLSDATLFGAVMIPIRFLTGGIRRAYPGLPLGGLLRCGRHSLTALRRSPRNAPLTVAIFNRRLYEHYGYNRSMSLGNAMVSRTW